MSVTDTRRPGKAEELSDDLKRILDEHVVAAENDERRVSRHELLRDGLAKLKRSPSLP